MFTADASQEINIMQFSFLWKRPYQALDMRRAGPTASA